ncbi:hypothetical protein C0Q70_18142 [Pomacea canaliculata]|uniref:LRAT domain-containing protein n=1 Tax=Pomacea canaliculata TaxID=400727 RepID=A0A2T7NMF0_POMCA|nr:hypothetical protein C0Q70_18142 [Pomacea canaliculata]
MGETAIEDVYNHNLQQLSELQAGDMIEFKRGDGDVVHLAGEEDDGIDGKADSTHLFTICGRQFNKAVVRVDKFLEVAGNSKAVRNNKKDKRFSPCPPEEIVTNALAKLGKVGYNVLYNNCEHFASLCRYGIGKSSQADSFLTGLSVLTAIATTVCILFGLTKTSKEKKKQEDTQGSNI